MLFPPTSIQNHFFLYTLFRLCYSYLNVRLLQLELTGSSLLLQQACAAPLCTHAWLFEMWPCVA